MIKVEGIQTSIGQMISYECFYDLLPDNNVQNLTACSLLSGVGFSSYDRCLGLVSNFNQSGPYEIKIIGSASGLVILKFLKLMFKIKIDLPNYLIFQISLPMKMRRYTFNRY